MTEQLGMFDYDERGNPTPMPHLLPPPPPPTPPPPPSAPPPPPTPNDIYSRWFKFHVDNPHVYRLLRKLSLDAAAHRHVFGIGAITEVARWERRFSTEGEDYKMPNAFRSMYARLLMEQEHHLVDFFHTAELRTADWPTDHSSVRARTASVL